MRPCFIEMEGLVPNYQNMRKAWLYFLFLFTWCCGEWMTYRGVHIRCQRQTWGIISTRRNVIHHVQLVDLKRQPVGIIFMAQNHSKERPVLKRERLFVLLREKEAPWGLTLESSVVMKNKALFTEEDRPAQWPAAGIQALESWGSSALRLRPKTPAFICEPGLWLQAAHLPLLPCVGGGGGGAHYRCRILPGIATSPPLPGMLRTDPGSSTQPWSLA